MSILQARRNYVEKVIEFLRDLEEDGYHKNQGLCEIFEECRIFENYFFLENYAIQYLFDVALKDWKHYSGEMCYPINFSTKTLVRKYDHYSRQFWGATILVEKFDPCTAFLNLHKWKNDYGLLRQEMCGLLADFLEDNMEELIKV